MMEKQLHSGLKDIFSTILNNAEQGSKAPQIIVLQGSGHVFAPGGTVHVWGQPHQPRPNSKD